MEQLDSVQTNPPSSPPESKKSIFRAHRLIPAVLFTNAFFLIMIFSQYLYYLIPAGTFLLDYAFLFFLILLIAVLQVLGGIYYRRPPMRLLNIILLLIGMAMFGYIALFFNGPFRALIFILTFIGFLLNCIVFILNFHMLGNKRVKTQFLIAFSFRNNPLKKLGILGILLVIIIGSGIGAYYSFWDTIVVQAPNGFRDDQQLLGNSLYEFIPDLGADFAKCHGSSKDSDFQ